MDGFNSALAAARMFTQGFEPRNAERFGDGHINDTYKVDTDGGSILLQKLNTSVFTQPVNVMKNVELITGFLKKKICESGGDASRETLNLIKTSGGGSYYTAPDGSFWRAFEFIPNTKGYSIVENAGLMYTAGQAFGKFQKMLFDFPAGELFETIENFHNTPKRLEAFKKAVSGDVCSRAASVQPEINFVMERENDAKIVQSLLDSKEMPLRVTHNDTKLNNILIDTNTSQAVCIIDLDTVMPGSVLYDFGDSIRSGANAGNEDEKDLNKVFLNESYYEQYAKGYMSEAKQFLTPIEIKYLSFSARLLTYECGMRFLTDYLNGDVYFKTHRENHNLDRARSQFKLVSDMESKKEYMKRVILEA